MTPIQKIVRAAIAACEPPTAYQLAKRMGVSNPTVSDWVHGRTNPTAEHLLKLMEIAATARQHTPAQLQQASAAQVTVYYVK